MRRITVFCWLSAIIFGCLVANFQLLWKSGVSDFIFTNLMPPLLEDAALLTPQIIQKYGYPCETHYVTTPDGYILQMFRVPHGKSGPSPNRQVVFLQHALLFSSADFVLPGPGKGLAYVLADNGYDVWMGHSRGNRYSRNHTTLDTESKEFWDFSYHEIGIIDIPTMIKYAINNTKRKNLLYIGYSQGTTVFFVMGSEMPEMNKYVRAAFCLSPVTFTSNIKTWLGQAMAATYPLIEATFNIFGIYEFLPRTQLNAHMGNIICSENSIFQNLCASFIYSLTGFNFEQLNRTMLQIMFSHTPAGCSAHEYFSHLQRVRSGGFKHYDYGDSKKNLAKYGSPVPLDYNLSNVNVPVLLYKTRNDWISDLDDVKMLADKLPNVQEDYLIPHETFNHYDYVYAKDVVELLYNKLISDMAKYPE